jgi:hypothetical protein
MRKEKRSISIAAVSLALVVVIWSAGLADAADPLLWPLQEGQWMEFLIQSPSEANPWKAQIKVIGSTTVDATQYFSVEIPQWGQGTQEQVFLRSTEKGLYRLEAEGECTVADLGQSDTTFRCRTAAGGWEVTALLAQAALEVPAGTFTTAFLFRKHIVYDSGSMSPDWDVYIVPGVGLVKQVEYDGNFRDGQSPPGVARSMELAQIGTPPEVSAKGTQSAPAAAAESKPQSQSAGAEGTTRKVAALGTIVEMRTSGFILKQEALQVSSGKEKEFVFPIAKHELSIGYVDNHLEVITDNATQVVMGGTSTPLSALRPGMHVVAAGMTEDNSLRAVIVSDLSGVGLPSKEPSYSFTQSKESAASVPPEAAPLGAEIPVCTGQDMDYDGDPTVAEFQGCFAGPTRSGTIPVNDFHLLCPGICWTIHQIDYTARLGGWSFDFPFKFSASSSNLTYHVPSSASLNVLPLPATEGEATFSGGLGIDLVVDIDMLAPCVPDFWNLCDYNFYTLRTSLGQMYHATGAAPITSGQELNVDETACIGVYGIGIPDTPIDVLSIEGCMDLTVLGGPFEIDVTAKGINELAKVNEQPQNLFEGPSHSLSFTPDSNFVDLTFNNFEWHGHSQVGVYLRFSMLSQRLFDTPPITIVERGQFPAITTPFPLPGSFMSLARDPNSPADNPQYLYQPTEKTIRLPVNPAPTRLTIIPFSVLPEKESLQGADQGSIQAVLREDYSGAPIVGENVAFSGNGVTVNATTDSSGIARATLPLGEYELSASFAGSAYYQPCSANQMTAITPPLVGLKGTGKSFSYKGAAGSISFTVNSPATPGAVVSVNSFTRSPAWIEVDPSCASQTLTLNPKGKATGTVKYRVLPCEESLREPRVGSIWVGDHEFVITQTGAPCKLTISPSKWFVSPDVEENKEILVSAPEGCTWTAATESDWINIVSGAGDGNGTVTYSVPLNDTGKNRSGKILISTDWEKPSRKTHTVTQKKSVPLGAPIADMAGDTYTRP